MIVTPAAISSSFFCCLTILLTSASSVRLLIPRISCGLSVVGAIVGEFFAGYGTEDYGLGYLITVIVAQIVLGILASTIVMSFSRAREFKADKGGAVLAGREKMIAALERLKVQNEPEPLPDISPLSKWLAVGGQCAFVASFSLGVGSFEFEFGRLQELTGRLADDVLAAVKSSEE